MAKVSAVLDKIRSDRAEIEPARVAQLALLALPYALGYAARWVFKGVWWVVSFVFVAAKAGWRAGGGGE